MLTYTDHHLYMWAILVRAKCTNETDNHSHAMAAYITIVYLYSHICSLQYEAHMSTQMQCALKVH